MKIYISCNGFGFGHVRRCLCFANELKKNNLVIFSSWGLAADYIRKNGFRCYELPTIKKEKNKFTKFLKSIYFPIEIKPFLKQIKIEKRIIRIEKPDMVISDCNFAHVISSKMNIPNFYITNPLMNFSENKFIKKYFQKYLNFVLSSADKIIVSDFPSPHSISEPFKYFKKNFASKISYVGPLIGSLPEDYASKSKLKKKLKMKKICFISISDTKSSILENEVLFQLNKLSNLRDWFFLIESSKKDKLKYKNMRYVRYLDDINYFLKASDIVISDAEYSNVCDILAFSKKSILIPRSDNAEQKYLVDKLEKKNLCRKINFVEINKKLKNMILDVYDNKNMETSIKKFSRMYKKYNGIDNIINLINKEM